MDASNQVHPFLLTMAITLHGSRKNRGLVLRCALLLFASAPHETFASSESPTFRPSFRPTPYPTSKPSSEPTPYPTWKPTTSKPSSQPTTLRPSSFPTPAPTIEDPAPFFSRFCPIMATPAFIVLLLAWWYPDLRLTCRNGPRKRNHPPPTTRPDLTARLLRGADDVEHQPVAAPVPPPVAAAEEVVIDAEVVLDNGKATGSATTGLAEAVVVNANVEQPTTDQMRSMADQMRMRRELMRQQRQEMQEEIRWQRMQRQMESRAEAEAAAEERRMDRACMSNPARHTIHSQNSRCSIFSLRGYFTIFAMQSIIGIACLHGLSSVLCINSFFSVLSLNSFFSVCSINSVFSVGCVNSAWTICSNVCISWW